MQLRFVARESGLVYVPGLAKIKGQAPPYLGRKRTTENGVAFPATREGHTVNIDDTSPQWSRYMKLARSGEIWPADETTAKAMGVSMPDIEFNPDGAWVLKSSAKETE